MRKVSPSATSAVPASPVPAGRCEQYKRAETVNAGDVALTPGASIKEGFVTLTRESGAATTTDEYVFVGTNVAMARDFGNEISVADRLIILVYLTPFNLQPPG